MRTLRENVDLLREFMQGTGPGPGATPGSIWSASIAYPMMARQDGFADDEEAEKRKFKDKSADKRAALRKLAVWLQQKGKR